MGEISQKSRTTAVHNRERTYFHPADHPVRIQQLVPSLLAIYLFTNRFSVLLYMYVIPLGQ